MKNKSCTKCKYCLNYKVIRGRVFIFCKLSEDYISNDINSKCGDFIKGSIRK